MQVESSKHKSQLSDIPMKKETPQEHRVRRVPRAEPNVPANVPRPRR